MIVIIPYKYDFLQIDVEVQFATHCNCYTKCWQVSLVYKSGCWLDTSVVTTSLGNLVAMRYTLKGGLFMHKKYQWNENYEISIYWASKMKRFTSIRLKHFFNSHRMTISALICCFYTGSRACKLS